MFTRLQATKVTPKHFGTMQRNRHNFLRWFDAQSEPLTPIPHPLIDDDAENPMPIVVQGETYYFYVNTPDFVAIGGSNPVDVKLYTLAGVFVVNVGTANVLIIQNGAKFHNYGSFTGPAIADGCYQLRIGAYYSNTIRLVSDADYIAGNTVLVKFRNNLKSHLFRVYYGLLPAFYQQFRIPILDNAEDRVFDGEVYRAETTGKERAYSINSKKIRTLTFAPADFGANEAIEVLKQHSLIYVNGIEHVPNLSNIGRLEYDPRLSLNVNQIGLVDNSEAELNYC